MSEISDALLEAFLDEALDAADSSRIEQALRKDETLQKRLSVVAAERDAGWHGLGAIWRKRQIGVPSREKLGSYLMGLLEDDEAEYIRFRVEVLKCPFTLANLQDLQNQGVEEPPQRAARSKRYFQSSAGYLRGER